MKHALAAIVLLLSFCGQTSAQENETWELDEVIVSDTRFDRYSEGHKQTVLADSTIARHNTFLTSVLAFNTNIYFKENGFGMVSSPAFRGTNASHTAVVWNGININSPLNGQVDFNTIDPFNYSSIGIRSGGGSVQYGTGAIGGSIHLNNRLRFEKHFDNRIRIGYGSFDTKRIHYGQNFGNGKWSHSFGVNFTESDNDYAYPETKGRADSLEDRRNSNGQFENLNLNFNSGYVVADGHVLRLYHQSFIGDRNLSGTLVAPGRSRYEDNHFRTQLEWVGLGKKTTSKLKLAHLYEGFKYFENKDSERFSEGNVTTLLVRYSHDAALSDALRLNSYLEYNRYQGGGSNFGISQADGSSLANPRRNDISATTLLKHDVSEALVYAVGLRKDFSSDFSSPLIFSLDGKYRVGEHYGLQLNASRNFRMPTFNDLYWNPGGHLELVPESSYQVDLGQRVTFDGVSFNLNGFYIATENMIRWLPTTSGIWSPSNIDAVRIYGLEGELAASYSIEQKQNLEVKANYAYTVSQDETTREQLIYVPFHRANASLAFSFSRFSLFYQHLYNGAVSILGGTLESYQVANFGVDYSPSLQGKLQYRLGVTLNNIFDTYYENVALRPMPNRNIQTRLTVNF